MSRLSIARRLAAGFAAVLVLVALILSNSIWRLNHTARETEAMMAVPLAKERLVSDWYANVNGGVRRTIAIARSNDPSLTTFFADDTAEAGKAANEFVRSIEALVSSPEERALFQAVVSNRKQFVALRDAITQYRKEGQEAQAIALLNEKFLPQSKAYLLSMRALLDYQRKDIDAHAKSIAADNAASVVLMLALGATALGLGIFISYVITRSITQPLKLAVVSARRVADGDLSTRLPSGYSAEIGDLLNALSNMQEQLSVVVKGVRDNARSVSIASREISQGNLDLSQRTEEQASALEQTAATMEQFGATVRNNADNARLANELAAAACGVVGKGGEVVSDVVETMKRIDESSKMIGDIIGVIDGLAFQTNILALNAAVEAARAGEQGRGFAVVAGEVRTLAQRSAKAAKEIKSLIEASLVQVRQGTVLADQAGTTMRDVVQAIDRVSGIIGEISSASAEQSEGAAQIGVAINQIDQTTQQNAALVEESAAAAQSLEHQSRLLLDAVSVFKPDGSAA
ncbi:membrane protein [Paraburkholderia caffeinilytica]|nr:methyl-accepting chemotaxis protein [Paraburkholderia caffeinilytica]AXL49961.1 membrane protein [Paraburkholderia caffeinilytica]CAB3786503.1 hypothetical protein LMG28690_02245 [Paraburkholderia caffeinilytica]